MKEYIEREAVLERLAKVDMDTYYGFTAAVQFGVNHAIQCIKEAPAADVVEVTFCKDCRYYQDAKVNEKGFLICPASGMEITVMDYCSYGALVDGKKTPSCHDGVCEIPGIEETDHA